MRGENMHPGGYEGSVTGAEYLEDDDNGTQLEDTRWKILLEIRKQFPCTTVENASRGITGELVDPDWEVAGSTLWFCGYRLHQVIGIKPAGMATWQVCGFS